MFNIKENLQIEFGKKYFSMRKYFVAKVYKNKKVGSTTYLLSLKLTNLTKPKLMKKNVLQMYDL